MKKVNKRFLQTKLALLLVVVLSFSTVFQLGYSATPDPYIATTDADRISVASPLSKIYFDNSSTVASIPSNITVSKVVNLKPAMTTYKNTFMDNATPDNTVNNQIVTDNKAIIAGNNTLISNYKTNSSIATASSLSNLQSKIAAATGNITIKINNLDIVSDVTIGSPTKSVTLIVTNFNVNKNNKTLKFYGNLVILNSLNSNNNFLTLEVKKTSTQNDGNLYIDTSININTEIDFKIDNMFYEANNFACGRETSIISKSIIIGGSFSNSAYGSTFTAADMFYTASDITLSQYTVISAGNLFAGANVNNNSYNSSFNITNTFFVANSITLSQKAVITAKDLVVACNVSNNADSSSFNVTNTFYIANDLTLSQKASIYAQNLIIDGNAVNSSNASIFDIENLFYIDDNFTLTQNATVLSNSLFVGGKVTSSPWDQKFDIIKDIFFGGLTLSNKTTIKSTNGDLIIEGDIYLSSDISFQVGGRVAVGGSTSNAPNSFIITAGGKTTAVIFSDEQVIQTPPPIIISGQGLTVKQAIVTQSDDIGGYALNITYKRVQGATAEQIIINNSTGGLIKRVDVNPAITGVADSEGFVTIENINFASTDEYVSVYVKATFQQSSGGGVNWNGKNDKPYFTTVPSEKISIPISIPTIYVDPSGHISMPSNINKVEVKFLKKAIADYGDYFNKLKYNQYMAYENAATTYNDKTIEQIEAIIAGSTSPNIIIKTNKLNLTKDVKLGSATKSVTLIVDELNVNSPRVIEVFGNLVIAKDFNANQAITIKTYKVSGNGGNFYTENANYNGSATLNIANTLYANSITLNQGGAINAGAIVISGRLTVNNSSQILAVNDIYAKNIIGNQSLNINSTYGDLVVRNTLRINSTFALNVGGRVSVGKNVTFNATATVTAGGQKTALILPNEGTEIIIVNGDLYSNIIKVNLNYGPNYITSVNKVASFNSGLLYFAGDSIYYKIILPTDISNVKLTYSLNEAGTISLFNKFTNTNSYCINVLPNGNFNSELQTNSNPVNLVVGPISVAGGSSSYIFKTKLSPIISYSNIFNNINNVLTISYTNTDGINLTVTRKFFTTIIAKPSLRLN